MASMLGNYLGDFVATAFVALTFMGVALILTLVWNFLLPALTVSIFQVTVVLILTRVVIALAAGKMLF